MVLLAVVVLSVKTIEEPTQAGALSVKFGVTVLTTSGAVAVFAQFVPKPVVNEIV